MRLSHIFNEQATDSEIAEWIRNHDLDVRNTLVDDIVKDLQANLDDTNREWKGLQKAIRLVKGFRMEIV